MSAAASSDSGPGTTAQALAQADFSALALRFSGAGFDVALPAPGFLQVRHAGAPRRASVLVSVGVHGDETGPLEMLAHLLDALSHQPLALAVDLMVCVGNPAAIGAGRRFIDADLNRMFRSGRGALAGTAEAARADAMIAASAEFFRDAGPQRWHLDLHAAIRPSLYPTFAIVPELIKGKARTALTGWLGQAVVNAVIINPKSAGTFSYYSAEHFGAAAATLEIGQVGPLGKNDLNLFTEVKLALDSLLRAAAPAAVKHAPQVFRVVREIIKTSEAFRMSCGRDTPNFTALPPGAVIATDGPTVHTVGQTGELLLFPNPDVRVGLRAALMVMRQN